MFRRTAWLKTFVSTPYKVAKSASSITFWPRMMRMLDRRYLAGDLRAAGLGPVKVEELAAGLVGALVGVGSEEVALSLQEVRR